MPLKSPCCEKSAHRLDKGHRSSKFLSQAITKTTMPSLDPTLQKNKVEDHSFFEGSKTASSIGKVFKNGTFFAVPFPSKANNSAYKPLEQPTAKSVYTRDYTTPVYSHVSMKKKKPMVPYHPLAGRNRLAENFAARPDWNASHIDWNQNKILFCEKKRFVTTYQTNFHGEKQDLRSNTGVTAYAHKWKRTADLQEI